MKTLNKLILLFCIVFVFISKGYSQNADPGIGILMSPASLLQGSTGILSTTVGNYGNATIVSNSLRVTIGVGANAEILGIALGSDTRWSLLTLTTGSANTIRLTNTGGGFDSFDVGDILLIVRGNVVSNPDNILGNIVYIAAPNPLLCGGCSSPPLNASQGNASTSNDNSQTSLAVTAPVIDAVVDTTVAVNGLTGGTSTALTSNDTLNGSPVVIGTAPGNVTLTGTTVPTGLTLNANGTVTIAPNTPAGNYSLTYQICEVSNPSNCDSVTSTIVVSAPVIDAVIDTTAAVNGLTGGTSTALTSNDTLNGSPVVIGTAAGNVTLSAVGTVPTGLTLNANGTVTIAPNTPAGSYSLTYQICEVSNPSNCDSVTSTIVVSAPVIDAVVDTTVAVNGLTGGTSTALTSNDTLNGSPVVIGTAAGNVTLTGVTVPAGLTLNADGTVTIAANTPAGSYSLTYQICEVSNSLNCDSVTSTIVVSAPVIDAVVDTTAAVNGLTGGTSTALTSNDLLNGIPVVIGIAAGNVTLTGVTVPAGLTLNANGTVTIAPNTPAGSYSLTYQICEVSNPSNCDSVTSTIVVSAPVIDAVIDTTAAVNGLTGGTSTALTSNDTLNGSPVVIGTAAGNVTLTGVTVPAGLTLNADGTVTIAANTPAGSYSLTYQICEVSNPSNCDSVTSTIVVSAPVIDAVADIAIPINGLLGGTNVVNILTNDILNGTPVSIAQVNLTTVTPNPNLTLNANGSVDVAANTPAGTYLMTYQICEVLNPTNCNSATVTVEVFRILPDFTPTIDIDAVLFLFAAPTKDFVVNISEIGNAPSAGQVVVKIPKQSAFTITYGAVTSTSNVFGGVSVNNNDWIITENSLFITMTLKVGVTIGANTISAIGFSITLKPTAPTQTVQPITATIVNGSGTDGVDDNNTYNTNVKVQ
jgi:hypothetical protein